VVSNPANENELEAYRAIENITATTTKSHQPRLAMPLSFAELRSADPKRIVQPGCKGKTKPLATPKPRHDCGRLSRSVPR